MNKKISEFSWTIDNVNWPPSRRPLGPFGPTMLDILRSCPLRGCFEISDGYERRTGYAARIGTALHKTLQSLTDQPPIGSSDTQRLEEATDRFMKELKIQDAEREKRPRERSLTKDVTRINLAMEKIMSEALRIIRANEGQNLSKAANKYELNSIVSVNEDPQQPDKVGIEVEVPVKSRDGLLYGRIDLVEHKLEGTHLIDYKFALRSDLPERYQRQLQLYALLWYESRGEWPNSAEIIYPLTGSVYSISIDPDTCRHIGAEARSLISKLRKKAPADQLATPGEICSVCEFRPWCEPFWKWQADEKVLLTALRQANLGFEGEIINIELKNFHWKLMVKWRNCIIRIVAPLERFPQLHTAEIGMQIRALDMHLHGQQMRPQATVTEMSEIFLILEKASH